MNVLFPDAQEPPAAVGDGAGLSLPQAVLDRHGARVLVPAEAVQLYDRPPVEPTVYRSRVLLVPDRLLGQGEQGFLWGSLAKIGLAVDEPPPLADSSAFCRHDPDHQLRGGLPRRIMLRPLEGSPPVQVDAWTALQVLRDAARSRPDRARDTAQITLEHLLVGSAITGAPGATEGSSTGDGDGVASYARPGGGGRMPLAYLPAPPAQRRLPGRRPVVAVLDTGIGPNRWLGIPSPGGAPLAADGFVRVDPEIQDAVLQEESHKLVGAGPGIDPIRDQWDQPVTARPLVGELDTHTGHGTFIAGIIRQRAPDARVLSIRIMHSDGIVYEGDLRQALHLLALRAQRARASGARGGAGVVDVVSLSLGYYHEEPLDETITVGLATEIRALCDRGVIVVAAAGNFASSRPFYPAALTSQAVPRLFAVGALNPNGSTALFSNAGRWVNCLAPGAAVVSTFPELGGAREPALKTGSRETLDGDDFRSGFASWSGTSFAAPLLAAELAQAMADQAVAGGGLDAVDTATTIRRAEKAVSDVRAKYAVGAPDDGRL